MKPVPGPLWPRLLAQAWAALGVDPHGSPLPADLVVTGEPGHLPSRLPVEDTAIACAGAALLAAAALHEQRSGDLGRRGHAAPSVRVDRGQVAAAFRSEAHLRLNGEASGAGFAPLSRFWRAADGWVRTHGNYPWHREALLRALGTSGDPESVAAAIAGRGAREVEDVVVAAGGVAAAVRSQAEWLAEPPGRAVAATALVEGALVGGALVEGGVIDGAPPRRGHAGPRPASGIRVLDLTRVIAGPVATRYLAALGADVLRLDPPDRPELAQQCYDGLLGKRSALLDLGTRDGAARFHELLGAADVLVHGYRPHALDRFGLTPDALAERHPGLVVVSLSAWGSTGPWGGRRGFDSIVQAACGIAVTEGGDRPGAQPGAQPGALPCQLLDHGTGYLCAAAALRALAAQSDRGGTHVRELGLARTAHWLLGQPREPAAASVDGDPDPAWLTVVASADGPVTVVRPPGRLGGQDLGWPSTLTRYGGDPPSWR